MKFLNRFNQIQDMIFFMEKEIAAKRAFIENKLTEQLSGFGDRIKYNRRKTFINHLLVVILGGLVTLSNGLGKYEFFEYPLNKSTQIISMILGILISGVATYNGFFNNKKLWIVYTSTTNELRRIRDDYGFYIAGKDNKDIKISELKKFKDRIQKILDETNNNWGNTRGS